MNSASSKRQTSLFKRPLLGSLVVFGTLSISSVASAQNPTPYRDPGHDLDRDRTARLEPGTVIPVRVNESINVAKGDMRVYPGIVDRDVRNGPERIIIPRGSSVELMVRNNADNDLTLDLDSIVVNGQRYALRAEERRVPPRPDDSLVGNIVGAINGEARGRAVRIPRDTVVTFHLARPLDVGVPDIGVDRDGHHYHDSYYDRYNH
jgi:hypothetical protein